MSGGVVGGLVAGGGSSGSTGGRLGTPDPRRRINMEQVKYFFCSFFQFGMLIIINI